MTHSRSLLARNRSLLTKRRSLLAYSHQKQLQNNFHGYAFERYADGGVYVGQFKLGLRNGLGQFTMAGGRSYSGQVHVCEGV